MTKDKTGEFAITPDDGLPKGVTILSRDDLLAAREVCENLDPALLAGEVEGVEFDQRCFSAFLKNLVLGSGLFVVTILILKSIIEFWTSVIAFLVLAYFLLNVCIAFRAVAVTLTWRAWLIFSPGSIVWIRTSFWKTEKSEFALDGITGITNGHVNGGGDAERGLYVTFHSGKHGPLLHNCDRAGLCAWAARRLREALPPGDVEFIDVDDPDTLPKHVD